jgi:hypothetical protein
MNPLVTAAVVATAVLVLPSVVLQVILCSAMLGLLAVASAKLFGKL